MRHKSILFTLAALLTLWPLTGIAQQEAPPHRHGATQADEPPTEGHQMMARHQEMQQRMLAMDSELDDLLEQVRIATGDAKVEAVVEVVEKLVEQRKAMHAMMQHHQSMTTMMMHHQMMEKHGTTGHCPMPDCPMMKKEGGGDDVPPVDEGSEPDEDHAAHHPE